MRRIGIKRRDIIIFTLMLLAVTMAIIASWQLSLTNQTQIKTISIVPGNSDGSFTNNVYRVFYAATEAQQLRGLMNYSFKCSKSSIHTCVSGEYLSFISSLSYANGTSPNGYGVGSITIMERANNKWVPITSYGNDTVGYHVIVYQQNNTMPMRCLWMFDTYEPLMQAWLSMNGTVLFIYNATPRNTTVVCSNGYNIVELYSKLGIPLHTGYKVKLV